MDKRKNFQPKSGVSSKISVNKPDQMNSVQDLRRQLKIINEQNKNLIKQLKQNQNITIEESNQNPSRRSSITSAFSNTSNTSNTSVSTVTETSRQSSQQSLRTSIPDSISSSVTVVKSGIAKPRGSLAKNICKVLNLQKVVYQGYRSDVRDLIKAGALELDKQWRDQDMKRILNLIKTFKQKNPSFPECINDWAIKEIARSIINNRREYSRDKEKNAQQNEQENEDEQNGEMELAQNENEGQEQDGEIEMARNEDEYQEHDSEMEMVPNEDEDQEQDGETEMVPNEDEDQEQDGETVMVPNEDENQEQNNKMLPNTKRLQPNKKKRPLVTANINEIYFKDNDNELSLQQDNDFNIFVISDKKGKKVANENENNKQKRTRELNNYNRQKKPKINKKDKNNDGRRSCRLAVKELANYKN